VTKDEFKELRAKAGHTQATLAKEMGVHLRTVTRWEIGEVIIPRVVELAIRYIGEHANKSGLTRRSTNRTLLENRIDVGAVKAALESILFHGERISKWPKASMSVRAKTVT
jgi:DNA-binding XRE family transcriptional regulator